jgi:hypothetical protein
VKSVLLFATTAFSTKKLPELSAINVKKVSNLIIRQASASLPRVKSGSTAINN